MGENKICMKCGEPVHADEGYYASSTAECVICDTCAARFTFKTLFTRAENTEIDFPFCHVFDSPIEAEAIAALEGPVDGPDESSVEVLNDMKPATESV